MVGAQEGLAPAVGEHDRAAEVAGLGAQEEGDEGGDLGGPTAPSDGNRELVEKRADLLVLLDLRGHGRLDVARGDGVQGYPRARPRRLRRVAPYPAGDRQLGRRIGNRRSELIAEAAGLLLVSLQARLND